MTAAISVRGVTKIFNEGANRVPVLHGVDLDVANGEVVLLMGPSGSGKTTLLSIMGCILRATSGSVRISGIEVANLRERDLPGIRLRHIGFVFQGFNLFPTLTVGENIELALDLKGVRGLQAKKEARQLLEQVGLADKYATFPSDLSGGQKQRVAIARALAGSAEIILADEPAAALDGHTGRTVIYRAPVPNLAANQFRGCIPGIHEVLRRQGLLAGRWCLDENEDLSHGQLEEIDRVCKSYPHLQDDIFVKEHLDDWLR